MWCMCDTNRLGDDHLGLQLVRGLHWWCQVCICIFQYRKYWRFMSCDLLRVIFSVVILEKKTRPHVLLQLKTFKATFYSSSHMIIFDE